MDTLAIANALCDEADDILAGISTRTEARASFAEVILQRHPRLAPAEKRAVIDQAIRILEREGFFEVEAGGDGPDAGDFTRAEGR